MTWYLRRCGSCGSYTLSKKCRYCGGETSIPHPAKFSPSDKYAQYRTVLARRDLNDENNNQRKTRN